MLPARVPRRRSFFFWYRSSSKCADAGDRLADVADFVGRTPLRPASRLSRNSPRLLPLGAVRPMPVMTIR